ncbi:hypothetical protein [Burkholderia cepacia]|uniref:hypothetical protein n=1 Tax=Burkholderia cepacia TaxID=292 RepID=UPI000F5F5ED1|nr:hypothetical protein [Burkholderia cepacia]
MFIHLTADECPARAGSAIKASRKRSPYRKIAVPLLARKWLPKNLTVTDAVSKTSMPSDTYAQKAFGCAPPPPPRKSSPFDGNPSYDNGMSPPEKSHLYQKEAQQKRDFFQSWRAFRPIRPSTDPENAHL